jgi:hypothetical protein
LILRCGGGQEELEGDGDLDKKAPDEYLEPINDPCKDIICGEHMRCATNKDGTEGICVCEEGYHMEGIGRCVKDVETCEGVTCSGHGKCILKQNKPICECEPGYRPQGLECIKADDPCEGYNCPTNSSCQVYEGRPVCVCNPGYIPDASRTRCVKEDGGDPCKNVNCPPNSSCEVRNGVAVCRCNEGYKVNDEGTACVPEGDPCDNVNCPVNSSCVVVDKQARCVCNEGYKIAPDGQSCIPENPCNDKTCPENSHCEVKDGKAVCECDEGYQRDQNGNCVAIDPEDPCKNKACPENSSCIIKNGNAICKCKDGYHLSGDGTRCIPNSESDFSMLCTWCGKDEHCGEGNICVRNRLGERFCSVPCGSGNYCPQGYNCRSLRRGNSSIFLCVPDNEYARCRTRNKPPQSVISYSFGTCPPPTAPPGTVGESLHVVVNGNADRSWFLTLAKRLASYGSYRVWLSSLHQHYIRWVWVEDNVPVMRGDRFSYCKSFPCLQIVNLNGTSVPGAEGRTYHRTPLDLKSFFELGGRFGSYVFPHEWFHAYYSYRSSERCTYAFESCTPFQNCHPLPSGCYERMKQFYPLFDFSGARDRYNPQLRAPDICIQVTDY